MSEPATASANNINMARGTLYVFVVAAALACVLAYSPGLQGPLFFDDVPNLLDNNLVKIEGRNFDDWRVAALSSDSGVLYRPVAMLSFALNYVAAGAFTPLSLKATNLAVHLGVGTLVYLLALALLQSPALRARYQQGGSRRLVAMLAASLWLLHPIHVSTVLYAVQRMAQLSALFTLLGLVVFSRYRLRWADTGAGFGEVLAAALWVALLGALAILSKENGALLPWLIAVLEVTLFRGVWAGRERQWSARAGWFALALPLLLLAALFIVSPESITGRYWAREFTLQERLLTEGRALWQYLSWLVFPNVLGMGFFHDDIAVSRSLFSPLTTALSLLGWLAVLAASLVWRRRYPVTAFAVLFYLVGHSLESTVYPLELVFEHRNYLPSVGFAVLAAVGIAGAIARSRELRAEVAMSGVVVILAALLVLRTQAWSDEMTLARFNVVNHPQSARANFFYANALFKRFEQAQALGLDEEEQRALAVTARRYFERMHSIDPRDFAAPVMLYQLDTLYFPGLAQKNDWLAVIQEMAETRQLQSSDRTALGALVEFSLLTPGEAGRDRVTVILERLHQRFPTKVQLLGYRYRLAAAGGNKAEFLTELESADRLLPDDPQVAVYMVEYHGIDDLPASYEALREWLRRDTSRRELPIMRQIFGQR